MDVGNLQTALKLDISGFTAGIKAASGALTGLKATIGKVAASLTALMANPVVLAATAVAALAAIGKAAYDAYVEIDKAYDAITVGTGATGEALDDLKESFDKVFSTATYVESAEDLAGIIADLNTYLGVTGEELEGMAAQFSNMKGMGMEVSVDAVAKAFNRWGIETSQMGSYLDFFFQVSQNTGISIDKLSESLAKNKDTLSTFGYSLEESTQLLGLMNKGGFELNKLEGALKHLTASGISTKEGFADLLQTIKSTADQSEALSIAAAAFGTEAKDSMATLIKSGAFDDLASAYQNSTGAIQNTANSTASFGDKMERVGRAFMDFGAKAGAVIEAVLSKLFDFFEWIGSLGEKLRKPLEKFFDKIGKTFSKFWNEGENTTGSAIENIMGFVEMLVDKAAAVLDWFLEYIWPAVEVFIKYLVTGIKLVSAVFAGDWTTAAKIVSRIAAGMMTALYDILSKGWDLITNGLEGFLQNIVNGIFYALNKAIDVVENTINGVISMINAVIDGLNFVSGANIRHVATVSWNLDTPTVPDFGSFGNTGIGAAMQSRINELNAIANGQATAPGLRAASAQTDNNVNITMNFNSPEYDYTEVTRAAEDAAQKMATSKTMQY